MRLGLFGGTFDPVHFGHLLLAERCREELQLDEVWFVPAKDPPHKDRPDITGERQRAEMLEFAIAGNRHFRVDRREFAREGPSYTVDTLTDIQSAHPQAELFFLMGADSLADLPTWRSPDRIAELATVVAVNRGDDPLPTADDLIDHLGEQLAGRVRFVSIPGMDLSSTELRARAAQNQSLRYATPSAVAAYVKAQEIYSRIP